MQLILQGDTRPIPFLLVSSTDHATGVTGATATVHINKGCAGSTYVTPAGSVVENGYGSYAFVPATGDTNTLGMIHIHVTATGADPVDLYVQVVAMNPYALSTVGDSSGNATLSSGTQSAIETATAAIVDGVLPTLSAIEAGLPSLSQITAAIPTAAQNATAIVSQVVPETHFTLGTPSTYTVGSMLNFLVQVLYCFKYVGTVFTIFKRDGVTAAHTANLDSTTPSSLTSST